MTVQQNENGSYSFVLTPSKETLAFIGTLLSTALTASGNAVVPSGYQPPPTVEDERKKRNRENLEQIGRENRREGRMAASRHRKLMKREGLPTYEAAKLLASDSSVTTQVLQIRMKLHREARDRRLWRMRSDMVLRLSDAGLTDKQIAERYGPHPKTIGEWRKKARQERTAKRQEGSQ